MVESNIRLTEEQAAHLQALASRDGLTPDRWLIQQIERKWAERQAVENNKRTEIDTSETANPPKSFMDFYGIAKNNPSFASNEEMMTFIADIRQDRDVW